MQRLQEHHTRLVERGVIPPPYYKIRKIRRTLELDRMGTFRGWSTVGADNKGHPMACPYYGRTSNGGPFLLVDKYTYFLGVPINEGDIGEAKAARYREEHLTMVEELHEALPEESRAPIRAALTFLTSEEELAKAIQGAPDDLKVSDVVGIRVGGEWIHDSPGVVEWWGQYRVAYDERNIRSKGICTVCGEERGIAATHPIKFSLGRDESKLVTANETAFEHYGVKGPRTSRTCLPCATRYGEALRALIEDPASRYHLGDVHFLHWTTGDTGLNFHSFLREPDPGDVDDLVRNLVGSVREGKPSSECPDKFYGMLLSTNMSRVVVRGFLEITLQEAQDNVARWFEGQRVYDGEANGPQTPYGLFPLAASLVPNSKAISPQSVLHLMRAALFGERLPDSILMQALARCRADMENRITKPRAALIKIALNQKEKGTVTERLDLSNRTPAYLCGRLMSALENLQYSAMKGIGTDIVGQFFPGALSSPFYVFPHLLAKAKHHERKLANKGARFAIQARIDEILAHLPEFPRSLTFEEQGVFMLGYHHQRHENLRRMKEAMEKKEEAKAAKAAEKAAKAAEKAAA